MEVAPYVAVHEDLVGECRTCGFHGTEARPLTGPCEAKWYPVSCLWCRRQEQVTNQLAWYHRGCRERLAAHRGRVERTLSEVDAALAGQVCVVPGCGAPVTEAGPCGPCSQEWGPFLHRVGSPPTFGPHRWMPTCDHDRWRYRRGRCTECGASGQPL